MSHRQVVTSAAACLKGDRVARLRTRPLQDRFGLEILDVDLAEIDDRTFEAILRAWQGDPLLLLRRQFLTERELVNFSKRFGELFVVPDYLSSPCHPEVMYISNLKTEDGSRLGSLGGFELEWHTDQSYQRKPATGSIFYAIETPEDQGQTSWCNTQLAYEALSRETQSAVENLSGISKYNGYEKENITEEEKQKLQDRYPEVAHPIVLTHPVSGKRSLYLDISTTFTLAGMPMEQSRLLLRELKDFMTRPEFVYRHNWQGGDVMMWDNSRLCHRRDSIDPCLPRLAKRTSVFLRPDQFPVP